ncbi:hypothetical protein M426DRAFT_323013 [Hypoxylon sp. CI-4A]|nr:hypothetical protein M426DRAFT_323013 [Hypoxylon sp. CI-4A]
MESPEPPELPQLPHKIPLNPSNLGGEVSEFLQEFEEPMLRGDCPYVHPRLVSFHSARDRAGWVGHMPDPLARDLFSSFSRAGPRHGKNTQVAVFHAPVGTLIGDRWQDCAWHAYLVAIIREARPDVQEQQQQQQSQSQSQSQSQGKRILIWDCDPVPTTISDADRWQNVLRGRQRTFVDFLRKKRHMKKAEIWYSVDDGDSGRDQSLVLSLRKLLEWASLGDIGYLGSEDPRFQKCVKLKA